MTDGTETASPLQDEQNDLLARIQEEPTTASVMEALDRLYSQLPAAVTNPTPTMTFGTGTNFNS